MKKVIVVVVVIALFSILFIAVALGALNGQSDSANNAFGLADIPSEYLELYEQASLQFSIPFPILAAIGKVECNHGRSNCGSPNAAGAIGPMQFLPSTFAQYENASGSLTPDITNPRDAIFAAAAKLSADNAQLDPRGALYSYNHADWYVAEVLAYAVSYGYVISDDHLLAFAVLNHPNIALRSEASYDVSRGAVDDRVLYDLLLLATTYHLGSVGPFIIGHSYYVEGTKRPSNHAFGRAVDIAVVNGQRVSPVNSAAHDTAELIASLNSPLRPNELGCPWKIDAHDVRIINEGHDDHLHIGFDD
jgi:hypothetical protein